MSSASAGTNSTTIEASNNKTWGAFFSSLAAGSIAFGVQVTLFLIARYFLPKIYNPRSSGLVPPRQRVPSPPAGLWQWFKPLWKTDDEEFMLKSGLDAYFFVRYLAVLVKSFLAIAAVALPILLPINGKGGKNKVPGNNVSGLNVISFGNIDNSHYNWFWAHLVIAVLVVGFVCYYLIWRELRNFIRIRQKYLTSPEHRLRASARTILVTNIPQRWMSHKALDELFDVYPGGIKHIWINRDYQELADKVDLRDKIFKKLESAETNLAINAKNEHDEQVKKKAKTEGKNTPKLEAGTANSNGDGASDDEADENEGITVNNQHQLKTLKDLIQKYDADQAATRGHKQARRGLLQAPLGLVGEGLEGVYDTLGKGVGAVTQGVGRIGQLGTLRRRVRGGSTQVDGPSDEPDNEQTETKVVNTEDFNSDEMKGDGDEKDALKQAETVDYPSPFHDERDGPDNDPDARWRRFLEPSNRDTTRLTPWSPLWLPFLPSWLFIGKKVDTIYHCRNELARLNLEIQLDQQRPERFPLMNSAFIQFNQQVAAHMACQSLTHHAPRMMTPRLIEISPDEVRWEYMNVGWIERDVRAGLSLVFIIALVIFFIIPSTFIGGLSQLSSLSQQNHFRWIARIPSFWQNLLQGLGPVIATTVAFALVPLILRLLHHEGGAPTRTLIERQLQKSYFSFLFINIFLFVTIISGTSNAISQLTDTVQHVTGIPEQLANSLPGAANYFFNYMLLQALSISAGALAQIVQLLQRFVLAPLLDTTARQKRKRNLSLPTVKWGNFFPVYTNLACIGLIYSVIAPFVLVFNILIFSLFWVAYRYNALYVNNFTFDTGGMLFPTAVKQLFTGLYVMIVCLIGLFFLVRPPPGHKGNEVVCLPQAIIMIIVGIATIIFQYKVRQAFEPLFEYLPITLEDDAVLRDEEFARKHPRLFQDEDSDSTSGVVVSGSEEKQRENSTSPRSDAADTAARSPASSRRPAGESIELNELGDESSEAPLDERGARAKRASTSTPTKSAEKRTKSPDDLEAQDEKAATKPAAANNPIDDSERYFGHLPDDITELSAHERDAVIERAFKHRALRALTPSLWLPRDDLGVTNSEIRHMEALSQWLPASSERAKLNKKGKVVFTGPPQDFSELDLIVV